MARGYHWHPADRGLLRLIINHHVTFFVNSPAFLGIAPYTEANSARDNGFLAFLTYGEGYHNYHHIFQTDYRMVFAGTVGPQQVVDQPV